MSISANPYTASSSRTPFSPATTTGSSLNYSSYGQTPNAYSNSRNASSSSSAYNPRPDLSRSMGSIGSASGGGLRPPGGGERKMESKEVAKIHWKALREFLASWLKEEPPSARASAREKLTRLTKLQFQELSTDVYDELMRRIQSEQSPEDAVPFLPVRDDFHPKRNQARQKLATLPRNRFKDLASDVYHELQRRFPEFQEEEGQDGYNDYSQTGSRQPPSSAPDLSRRMNPTPEPIQRLNSQHNREGSRGMSGSSSHRSRPSRDIPSRNGSYREEMDDRVEHLNGGSSNQGGSGGGSRMNPIGSTNEVVVPNKSRLREEEIEVPYARDSVLEPAPSIRSTSRASERDRMRNIRDSNHSTSTSNSVRPPLVTAQSAPVNSRNNPPLLQQQQESSVPNGVLSPTMTNDDREYYDRLSFSSNVTHKSRLNNNNGEKGWDEDREQKIRQEYEFKIAGLERKLNQVEIEREGEKRGLDTERERRREWEDEVRGLKERATTHASTLRSMQHELDIARDAAETARKHAESKSREADGDISQWRKRCDDLEKEIRRTEVENKSLRAEVSSRQDVGSGEAVSELRKEIHSLVDELNSLSARNDELVDQHERDVSAVNEMERKVEEYRRKYEAVRIELRNLKATSTMFISKPLTDDHLPASPDGNIADVNVSAFQTAIDGILAAARSSHPSGVLPAMKAVVEAITEIGEDVKAFEAHPNLDVDSSKLESFKHESTTRLSALMQAARNHAMASGLSPLSLIDAAAGHLSANVVEIIKLLKIRKTVRRSRSSISIKEMIGGPNGRDMIKTNGDYDKEYGPNSSLQPSAAQAIDLRGNNTKDKSDGPMRNGGGRTPSPQPPNSMINNLGPSSYSANNGNTQRHLADPSKQQQRSNINSYQSSSNRSDAFDLERKASMLSNTGNPPDVRPNYDPTSNSNPNNSSGYREELDNRSGSSRGIYKGRQSEESEASSQVGPPTSRSLGSSREQVRVRDLEEDVNRSPGLGYASGAGGSEEEWEELKPYLNTQSSALVNSIQNLLAAIRTNQNTPALTEHLSEVIAIASSIVAVAGNALPASYRNEGDSLIKDLVNNTNKLSEAQEAASASGGTGSGFGKEVRQNIASASFGVAKGLKSLMKLGVE